MVTISVIICTYNQEQTISRTLDAVIKQQCSVPFEVIIGEDCSRDSTRCICEDYVHHYPDLVRLMPAAPNKGIVENYYDCVRTARGEYIMECGGDDEWCPGRMQLCLDTIEQHKDVVQVFTQMYYRRDDTGEVTEPQNSLLPFGKISGQDVINKMMHQRPSQTASYAITRRQSILEAMEEHPQFFTGRRYLAEDKQLIVLLATKGNSINLPQRTFYYTIDNVSITRKNILKNFAYGCNMLLMTCNLAKTIDYKGSLASFYAHTLYNICTQLVWKTLIKLFPFLHYLRNREA